MSDVWDGEGYDASVGGDGGVYCRLKNKGESIRIRIVSEPIRYTDSFEYEGQRKLVRKVAWIAILKEIVNDKPVKRVVCFQNGPMVYGLIKDLAANPEWGDPTTYDVTITRTEVKGSYYTVHGVPKGIGPISKEDMALVKEANLDLKKLCAPRNTDATEEDVYDAFADE